MRPILPVTVLAVFLCTLCYGQEQVGGNGPADVPVNKVVLFSSGVGYFEHTGVVTGNATTELRFRSNQINDIIKSLVLQDLNGGKVGSVVYPSQDPLNKILGSFQVDISSNPSLGELLDQLRGAEVDVIAQGEKLRGVILGVEEKEERVGDFSIINTQVLNLVSNGNIRSFKLDHINQLNLVDPQLKEELNKALAALASARDQDKKPVVISFNGKGERKVRLGYVVETPVWKTAYRLIMLDDSGEKGMLQGWAIIENQTESDWNNIDLSLVSGRPISFIQNLYQPLYIPRPTVQPKLYASLTPQTYGSGMEIDEDADGVAEVGYEEAFEGVVETKIRSRRMRGSRPKADSPMLSPMAAPAKALNAAASVASLATASDVGELFHYTVPDVSLPRQRSAMIPIVTEEIQAERLSIYNRSVLANHPLNGALVTNTTNMHLLQGPVTVFDGGGYAGDARIDDLPADQHRLLSYAVDLDVQVNADKNASSNKLQTGIIVKGILHLQRKYVFSQEYVVDNKSDKDKTLIVEHPFRSGYQLVDTPKPFEISDNMYRFKDTVAAGKKLKLTVKEEKVATETMAILHADLGQIEYYSRSGEIPANVRKVLVKAMEMKSAMVDTERQIRKCRETIDEITREQARIRQNMQTVDTQSKYYTRLLTKLNDQETNIETLQSQIEKLEKQHNTQRKDLEDYLLSTNVG